MDATRCYRVSFTNSQDVADFCLEATSAVEAALRAFAHVADGWPEVVEIVPDSRLDTLTVLIACGREQFELLVSQDPAPD
jgi:hypothetical protein